MFNDIILLVNNFLQNNCKTALIPGCGDQGKDQYSYCTPSVDELQAVMANHL